MLNLYDIFTKTRDITLQNSTLEAARLKSTFFTRNRKMSFTQVLLFILKGINTSTQSALNRFFRIDPADGSSISQQALSKARSHFDHSPFEKMFRAVVEMRYCGEHAVRLRCGCRVPAVDGSAVALENFSGCSKNVILQEFWASMHPAGMAAAAEDEANAAIRKKRAGKDNKYEYAANLNQIIAILRDHPAAACFLTSTEERLRALDIIAAEIEKSVVPIRPGRSVERPLTPRKTKYHHNRKSHA